MEKMVRIRSTRMSENKYLYGSRDGATFTPIWDNTIAQELYYHPDNKSSVSGLFHSDCASINDSEMVNLVNSGQIQDKFLKSLSIKLRDSVFMREPKVPS